MKKYLWVKQINIYVILMWLFRHIDQMIMIIKIIANIIELSVYARLYERHILSFIKFSPFCDGGNIFIQIL